MKSKLEKLRSIAGLFLEALMFVFIFAYANGNFVASDTTRDEDQPLKSIVLSYTISIANQTSPQVFHTIPKLIASSMFYFASTINFHNTTSAFSEALAVNTFERKSFYIISADHIP
jgi:hypothetical protein